MTGAPTDSPRRPADESAPAAPGAPAEADDRRLRILHADMDAFYAAIEVLDDPRLAGKPVIVGHPGPRGVVSTASYEARRFGVHSALPSAIARRRCPQGIWRPVRMARYTAVSRQIRRIFARYTPEIEPLSLDEAFLDVGASLRLFGGAVRIARALQAAVERETGGLTVSVGVAENKFLAKLASDLLKPAGLTVVPPGEAPRFLAPLPIERLWGVGPATARRLHDLGLRTIGDVARVDEALLVREFGEHGAHLAQLAVGRDPRRVQTHRSARSISKECTFGEDIHDPDRALDYLFSAAEQVSRELRREHLCAGSVHLKLRTRDFRTRTRSRVLPHPTVLAEELHAAAAELFAGLQHLCPRGIRLLGVGAHGLLPDTTLRQGELFTSPHSDSSLRAARVSDLIRDRLGERAIRRGRQLRRPSRQTREGRRGRDDGPPTRPSP